MFYRIAGWVVEGLRLGVHDRADAVAEAMRRRLIEELSPIARGLEAAGR